MVQQSWKDTSKKARKDSYCSAWGEGGRMERLIHSTEPLLKLNLAFECYLAPRYTGYYLKLPRPCFFLLSLSSIQ